MNCHSGPQQLACCMKKDRLFDGHVIGRLQIKPIYVYNLETYVSEVIRILTVCVNGIYSNFLV